MGGGGGIYSEEQFNGGFFFALRVWGAYFRNFTVIPLQETPVQSLCGRPVEESSLCRVKENGCRKGQRLTPAVHFTEVSALQRVKENNEEYHGPILGVHFREMLILCGCRFSARLLTRLQLFKKWITLSTG